VDHEHAHAHPLTRLRILKRITGLQLPLGTLALTPRFRSIGLPSSQVSYRHQTHKVYRLLHPTSHLPTLSDKSRKRLRRPEGRWNR